MTALKIDNFKGIYPRVPPQLLPEGAGVRSEWVDHQYGELRVLHRPALFRALPHAAKSAYMQQDEIIGYDEQKLFTFTKDAYPVAAPAHAPDRTVFYFLSDDPDYGRLWKGKLNSGTPPDGGGPTEKWRVGVPRPFTGTWTVTTSTTPAPGPGVETRAYTITYVSPAGEEGPPSSPLTVNYETGVATISLSITRPIMGAVGVNMHPEQFENAAKARIYRSQAGGALDEYYFVGEVTFSGPGVYGFTDNVALVNEPLTTYDYATPPINGFDGLVVSPSGALVGWRGQTLHFSVEHKPWAWPLAYNLRFPAAIVRVVPHGTGLLVLTREVPYFVAGVDFELMPPPTRLDIPHPAVSPFAVASLPGLTAYASQDGIVMVNGNIASTEFSERYFTRDVWRARYLSGSSADLAMAYHAGRLLVYSRTGGFTPFLIDPSGPDEAMTELPGLTLQGTFIWPGDDGLYTFSGAQMLEFGASTSGSDTLAWESRELILERPTCLGAATARCQGNFVLRFYADDTLRHTQTINNGTMAETAFRLPAGFVASRWRVDWSGNGTFKALRMATTGRELAKV